MALFGRVPNLVPRLILTLMPPLAKGAQNVIIMINACVTNLSKLEEAIKAKDDQIYKLNLLVGKGNLKPKSDFKSHPAYDTARRFLSIGDGLGLTRGNKANGSKIVNGQAIPLWK